MAHNLIIPKQTGKIDVFYASLEIFYESWLSKEEWCENKNFKKLIVEKLPRIESETVKDNAYLVKQSELVRYFGFAIYNYEGNSGKTKITQNGIEFYNAYIKKDLTKQRQLLIEAILNNSFGRNNTAIESSNSDVDPPKLFLKSLVDLNGMTRKDLAYLLYIVHDKKIRYEDALAEFKASGNEKEIVIPEKVINKYSDVKFTILLRDFGIIDEINRRYYLSSYTMENYLESINKISIYNHDPEIVYSLLNRTIVEPEILNDPDKVDQNEIVSSFGYDINSHKFIKENERVPELLDPKSRKYRTNPRISKTALIISDFSCEINKHEHITFISKNGRQFMEAHHLIPMHAQKDFEINLDRIDNIVSICPNCHSAIHLGSESVRLDYLKKAYDLKAKALIKIGINISFGELFSKYYK